MEFVCHFAGHAHIALCKPVHREKTAHGCFSLKAHVLQIKGSSNDCDVSILSVKKADKIVFCYIFDVKSLQGPVGRSKVPLLKLKIIY